MQLNNSNVSSASDLQQPQTKQNPPEVKIIEAILTKILEYFSVNLSFISYVGL